MTERLDARQEQPGNGFLEDARLVYGEEGAMVISDSIISGLEFASTMLPSDERPSIYLRLAVMRPPGKHDRGYAVHAWAIGSDDQIAIMINPEASVPDIARSLFYAVPHEFAHIAHYRMNPEFGKETPGSRRFKHFNNAIKEGIARTAEQPESLKAYRQVNEHYADKSEVTGTIKSLLDAGADKELDEYDVLYGIIDEFADVYAAGHYAVSCLALATGRNLPELMRIPSSEYVEFAQMNLI